MDADINSGNGNGRVTLAVLGEQLKQLKEGQDRLLHALDGYETRIRTVETNVTGLNTCINQVTGDVDRLQSKDTWGSIITGLLAAIGIYLGSSK